MAPRLVLRTLLASWAVTALAVTDAEWSTTINKAGRQRMLSQKMSKEFFFVALGLDAAADKAALTATMAEFDGMLTKLVSGAPADSIAAPPTTGIADQLGVVQTKWSEFKALLSDNVDASPIPASVLEDVAAKSVPLLTEMNRAVGLYAAAAGAEAPGVVVNKAGRQRMLTQKMSKEAALVQLNVDATDNKDNLQATMDEFTTVLTGLRDGDSTLGLPATTDKCILAQLAKVRVMWSPFKALLEKFVAGTATTADLTAVRATNVPLLVEMNVAVGLYVDAASSGAPLQCTLPQQVGQASGAQRCRDPAGVLFAAAGFLVLATVL